MDILTQKNDNIISQQNGGNICHINPELILPNPSQPRKSFDDCEIARLADSISQHGIIQPLSIRMCEAGKYELIAGERRLRASKLIGLTKVPCIIMSVSRECSAELSIIENLQREDLNMFEQGHAIEKLMKMYHYTQAEVSQKLSMSQSAIANKLRILRFSSDEKDLIIKYKFSERHARVLLKLPCECRIPAIEYINLHQLNVAQTEKYIESLLSQKEKKSPTGARKMILKDYRLFFNSIDNAINVMKKAGINIEKAQNEDDEKIELSIVICKKRA